MAEKKNHISDVSTSSPITRSKRGKACNAKASSPKSAHRRQGGKALVTQVPKPLRARLADRDEVAQLLAITGGTELLEGADKPRQRYVHVICGPYVFAYETSSFLGSGQTRGSRWKRIAAILERDGLLVEDTMIPSWVFTNVANSEKFNGLHDVPAPLRNRNLCPDRIVIGEFDSESKEWRDFVVLTDAKKTFTNLSSHDGTVGAVRLGLEAPSVENGGLELNEDTLLSYSFSAGTKGESALGQAVFSAYGAGDFTMARPGSQLTGHVQWVESGSGAATHTRCVEFGGKPDLLLFADGNNDEKLCAVVEAKRASQLKFRPDGSLDINTYQTHRATLGQRQALLEKYPDHYSSSRLTVFPVLIVLDDRKEQGGNGRFYVFNEPVVGQPEKQRVVAEFSFSR